MKKKKIKNLTFFTFSLHFFFKMFLNDFNIYDKSVLQKCNGEEQIDFTIEIRGGAKDGFKTVSIIINKAIALALSSFIREKANVIDPSIIQITFDLNGLNCLDSLDKIKDILTNNIQDKIPIDHNMAYDIVSFVFKFGNP